ncbi:MULTISPECIES: hypothetical protein [Streptomyces violaceusniger group]|uniref:Uncharacterized protein n=2 Tax=Streptomyces rhizosphaericus TaxID=114699 RepID=A0ABN1P217_9ACTN|nr:MULTISPECIES: hypothetical protein [Streptomyces violaceusniger group]
MSAPREPHLPLAKAPWAEERGDKLRITTVRTFLTASQGCLAPLLRGRDPSDVEDLHRLALNRERAEAVTTNETSRWAPQARGLTGRGPLWASR